MYRVFKTLFIGMPVHVQTCTWFYLVGRSDREGEGGGEKRRNKSPWFFFTTPRPTPPWTGWWWFWRVTPSPPKKVNKGYYVHVPSPLFYLDVFFESSYINVIFSAANKDRYIRLLMMITNTKCGSTNVVILVWLLIIKIIITWMFAPIDLLMINLIYLILLHM